MIAWLMFRLLVLMIAVGVSITVFYYMLTLRASGKNRLALQMKSDLYRARDFGGHGGLFE